MHCRAPRCRQLRLDQRILGGLASGFELMAELGNAVVAAADDFAQGGGGNLGRQVGQRRWTSPWAIPRIRSESFGVSEMRFKSVSEVDCFWFAEIFRIDSALRP